MRLLFIPIFTILLHITAGAQTEQPNPAEIGVDPTVEIVTDYQGKILESAKLDISYGGNIPFFTNSTFSYQVFPLSFSSSFNMKPIPPASMQIYDNEKEQGLGYFRGGAGYPFTPDLNLYLRGTLKEHSSVNLYLNHRSFWGKVPMYKDAPLTTDTLPSKILGNQSWTRAGASLQHFWSKTAIDVRMQYHNTYLLYHGQDTLLLQQSNSNYANHMANDKYVKNNLSQTLHHVQAMANFYSIAGNSGNTNFNIGGLYEYIYETAHTYYNPQTSQHTMGLDMQLNQKTGETSALDFQLNSKTNTKYGENSLSDAVFNLIPAYQYRSERATLTAGVNVEGVYSREKFSANIYPEVNFSYAVIETFLTPYLSAVGGTKLNNYATITAENPYIMPGLHVANSRYAFDLNAGIKGSISNYVTYQVNAGYTMIDSMHFYTNSTDPLSMHDGITANNEFLRSNFDVYYDNMHKLSVELGLNVKINSFEALLKAGYFQYRMNNDKAKPWHLPDMEAGIDMKYTMDRWIFNVNGLFRGETPVLLNSSYAVPSTITPAYLNLGAMVEYRLNETLSVYMQGTNLLNNNYQQYYLYYNPGITISAGFSIVF